MSGVLRADHRAPLSRLLREVVGTRRFRLLVATFGDTRDRDEVIELVERDQGQAGARIEVDPAKSPRWLEGELARLAQGAARIHVQGFERLNEQRDAWLTRLNYGRESISASTPAAVIFWMFDEDASAMAHVAPDLWAWRAGVYDFPPRKHGGGKPLMARFALGNADHKRRRLAEIERYLSTPLAPPTKATASLHGEAGAILLELQRNEEALEHARNARVMFKALGDERLVATQRGLEGRALLRLRRLDEAEASLQEALEVFERHGDMYGQSVVLADLARLSRERGDAEMAIQTLRRSLRLSEMLGDVRSQALVLEALADLLGAQNRLEEASALLSQRLTLQPPDAGVLRAKTLSELGMLDARKGLYSSALERFKEASAAYERLGEQRERDIVQGHIANVHLERGELQPGLELVEHLIKENRARGDQSSVAHNLWLKGRLLEAQGRRAEALVELEDAYRMARGLDTAHGAAMIGRDYGRLLVEAGRFAEAREVLDAAMAGFLRMGDEVHTSEVQHLLQTLSEHQ